MYPHSEDLCLFLKRSNTPSCYNLAKEKSKKTNLKKDCNVTVS